MHLLPFIEILDSLAKQINFSSPPHDTHFPPSIWCRQFPSAQMALCECVPTGNVHYTVSRIWALNEGLTLSHCHCCHCWVNRKDPIAGRCSKLEMGAEKHICIFCWKKKTLPMYVAALKSGANAAFVLLEG